jgi:hypothetical protein
MVDRARREMKIRFYHWWVYKLFRLVWNPIFASNAKLTRHSASIIPGWLD